MSRLNESTAGLGLRIHGGEKVPWCREETLRGMLFGLCVLVLAVVAWHHEPWLDEAQAWLLVKDSSLWELLAHRLRYEGHPPLWYLLLWIPVKAGFPYRLYPLLPVLLAAWAAWLVLFRSPFPLIVRVLMPFGFFTLYQYGVIARSYALVPPLLFWLACVYPDRLARPGRFWTPLLLLLFSAIHGAVFALAAAGLAVLDLLDAWKGLPGVSRRGHLLGAGWMAVSIGLLAWMLWPPADVVAAIGLTEKNPVAFVNNAMTGYAGVTVLVLGVSFLWMDRWRVLLAWVAPVTGLFILASRVYKIYHEGMFYLAWVFAMWLAWQRFRDGTPDESAATNPTWDLSLRYGAVAVMVLVGIIHVWWGLSASVHDIRKPYSGSRELAGVIREQVAPSDKVFATGALAVSVLPWLSTDPFTNLADRPGERFVHWSTGNRLVKIVAAGDVKAMQDWLQETDPDWIVVPVNSKRNRPVVDMAMKLSGYRAVRLCKGEQFWKTGVFRLDGYLLMQKLAAQGE